jgi:restriction system protein
MAARFEQYLNPILEALRALGGSARPDEVYEWIAVHRSITAEERSIQNKSGVSRFENDVAWARFYLARGGLLDSSRFGVWSLTEQGRSTAKLSSKEISDLHRRVRALSLISQEVIRPTTLSSEQEAIERREQEAVDEELPSEAALADGKPENYRESVLKLLRSLPPSGFERFCQRILRESGFQQVKITGRSGDGGIDGVGVLQVNPFVSFKVLFQSKRYSGTVSASQVRDFRGAMAGRADKGLIITTGTFSVDAKAESVRDGVPPIELVDGQGLISLLETLELGLKPIKTFDVDINFFNEFQS